MQPHSTSSIFKIFYLFSALVFTTTTISPVAQSFLSLEAFATTLGLADKHALVLSKKITETITIEGIDFAGKVQKIGSVDFEWRQKDQFSKPIGILNTLKITNLHARGHGLCSALFNFVMYRLIKDLIEKKDPFDELNFLEVIMHS